MDTLAERIKNHKLELCMSQDELARIMGYKSRSSINKLETSRQDIPRRKIQQLAQALQTTLEYILGWN